MEIFLEFAAELADGERWRVLRAEGWEEFEERLAATVADLPVRRRQGLIMLLFALVEELVTPPDVREWMEAHDVSDDRGIEEMIGWLRQRRGDRAALAELDAFVRELPGDPGEDAPPKVDR